MSDFETLIFDHHLVLVVASTDTSFRLVERNTHTIKNIDLKWQSQTIEALADIFMFRPALIIVFCDTNQEGLEFMSLVRNHPDFKQTPAVVICPEPLRNKKRLMRKYHLHDILETPLDPVGFSLSIREGLKSSCSKETKQKLPGT